MANLYLTIKLQGLGWNYSPTEEDYKKLARKLARVISQDKDFMRPETVVSIQVRGYNPLVKTLRIRKPMGPDTEIAFEEVPPLD